ncbi:hypothetical protein [Sphingopyxis sp. R3-92]|uniref:hypothetical protein n=1 Tax=Sphingopyxis sp. R3-92 TaxID=3158553 RepID=UPI003EE80463
MPPSPHNVAIAFRQGQVDALVRTLFASPALYPPEMRHCFALRSLQRAWDQYREDRAILTGKSLISAECAAERDAFLALFASILPKPRDDLGLAIARVRQIAIRPLAAEANETLAIVDAGADELASVRAVAESPKLPIDPVSRLLTIVRSLRRSADVEVDPLAATALSPCWAINLFAVADPVLLGLSPHPLPFPGLVQRRLFRADRDPEADRDVAADAMLEAFHETLCDIARVPRAAAAFDETFENLRGNSRLFPAWLLLFAVGAMTPAQLARALLCTKAGAGKLLRQMTEEQFAVHHGSHEPFVCTRQFPVSFSI